jgi:hypothetical protein
MAERKKTSKPSDIETQIRKKISKREAENSALKKILDQLNKLKEK